jgi:hypothetical protein
MLVHDVGQVQIYEIGPGKLERDRWSRRERLFGSAVALSEDGTIVAVGALTGSSGAGYVRVFRQNEAIWESRTNSRRTAASDNLGNRFRYRLMVKRFAIGHTRQMQLQGRGTYKFTNSLDQLGPKSERT